MDGELHGEVAMTNSRCESIMWDVGQKEVGRGWRKESIFRQMSAATLHGGLSQLQESSLKVRGFSRGRVYGM